MVFHALRLAFINLILDRGAGVREAQALARHSTPLVTMNLYARAREESLVQAVERVGKALEPAENYVTCMQQPAGEGGGAKENPNGVLGLLHSKVGAEGGTRTPTPG